MKKSLFVAVTRAALAVAAGVALVACAASAGTSNAAGTSVGSIPEEPMATATVKPASTPTPAAVSEITGSTGVPVESGSVWDSGGLVGTGKMILSDERVSGASTHEIHCDRLWEYEDATSTDCRTTMTITNAGGAWEGVVVGTSSWTTDRPLHVHHMTGTLVGSGDYEGLRFVFRMDGDDYPWTVAGKIEPDR
jgi:hypothetical protein